MGVHKQQWADAQEAAYYASPEFQELCYVEADRLGPSARINRPPQKREEIGKLPTLRPGAYLVVVGEGNTDVTAIAHA